MLDLREVLVAVVFLTIVWAAVRLALGPGFDLLWLGVWIIAALGWLMWKEWQNRRDWKGRWP